MRTFSFFSFYIINVALHEQSLELVLHVGFEASLILYYYLLPRYKQPWLHVAISIYLQ